MITTFFKAHFWLRYCRVVEKVAIWEAVGLTLEFNLLFTCRLELHVKAATETSCFMLLLSSGIGEASDTWDHKHFLIHYLAARSGFRRFPKHLTFSSENQKFLWEASKVQYLWHVTHHSVWPGCRVPKLPGVIYGCQCKLMDASVNWLKIHWMEYAQCFSSFKNLFIANDKRKIRKLYFRKYVNYIFKIKESPIISWATFCNDTSA